MHECVWFSYLHLIFSKDAVQDEIGPEHRPLTLDVLEQLEFGRIIVQSGRVLETQQAAQITQCTLV